MKRPSNPNYNLETYTNRGCLRDVLKLIFNLKILFKFFLIALMVIALWTAWNYQHYTILTLRKQLEIANMELRSSALEVEINQFILSCERKNYEFLHLPMPDDVGKGKVKHGK